MCAYQVGVRVWPARSYVRRRERPSERTMEMLGDVVSYTEVTRNAILRSELNATK